MATRNVGIEVEGAARLRRTLKAAGEDLGDLKAAHAQAAQIAARASTALTPVGKTGKLRASVRSSGTNTAGILRAGGARVPYAGPIHWGWHKRHITPALFLSRGAQNSEGQWLPVYERAVNGAINKIEGR